MPFYAVLLDCFALLCSERLWQRASATDGETDTVLVGAGS